VTATFVTLRAWTFGRVGSLVSWKEETHETQDQHQVRLLLLALTVSDFRHTAGLDVRPPAVTAPRAIRSKEEPMKRKTNVKAGGYAIRGV
jgi:hypothetical protein